MDSHRTATTQETDHHDGVTDGSLDAAGTAEVDDASRPFEGQWNRLISTTNWEKGRIIHQWRSALVETGAAASVYSDEAWALRVGGVSGQHVGRLRRVYQRFGATFSQYDGLYWSHFQAAIEWDDAEMWLEGAARSEWSVSQMRRVRWETMGSTPQLTPRDEDIVPAELDEDYQSDDAGQTAPSSTPYDDSRDEGPAIEGPDFGEADGVADQAGSADDDQGAAIYAGSPFDQPTIEFVRPFENLAELPDDLAEAFEAFKLAIIRHKSSHWETISRDDVLASLDALKALALAPSVEAL